MATVNATMLIFLQWAGYLLVFAIALHLVAHYAKDVIEHHHKIKGATAMAINAQAQGGEKALDELLVAVQAKMEARNGTKR